MEIIEPIIGVFVQIFNDIRCKLVVTSSYNPMQLLRERLLQVLDIEYSVDFTAYFLEDFHGVDTDPSLH